MLKLDLILHIINQIDHFQKEKNEKVIELMKNTLGRKIMIKFVGLRAKTYRYLIDDSSEYKKANGTKRVPQKENLNLKIIKTVWKQPNLGIK